MDLPWKSLPDLPDLSGLSNIELPNLPDLNALSNLAMQIQAIISHAIAHPLWTVALVLLSITLIQIVADLIKRSLKAILTLLLKLPLFASQWIWKRTVGQSKPPTNDQIRSKAEQANQLIAQLETLRQEQDQIITELKSLLSQSSPLPAPSLLATATPSPPTMEPLSEAQSPSA